MCSQIALIQSPVSEVMLKVFDVELPIMGCWNNIPRIDGLFKAPATDQSSILLAVNVVSITDCYVCFSVLAQDCWS